MESVAKRKPSAIVRYGGGLVIVLFVFAALTGVVAIIRGRIGPTASINPPATQALPPTQSKPVGPANAPNPGTPNYSFVKGDRYGYQQEVTEEDRKNGVLANPMVMLQYLGERGNHLQLVETKGEAVAVYDCERPCRQIQGREFAYGSKVAEQFTPNNVGTIGWSAFEDAQSGRLEQHVVTTNGKRRQLWYGDDDREHLYALDSRP